MLMLALLLGCPGSDKSGDDTAPVDDGLLHFDIVAPDDGATVGSCFTVSVNVTHFTLVSPVEHPDRVDGEGHWHLDFTDHYFDCEAEDCPLDFTGQPSGSIHLLAELVGSDHLPVYDADKAPIIDERDVEMVQDDCVKKP